ncbi:hypothetical protein HAX54_019681, partial [Datura stramonium]|nr:hypothetical protein [Datura stramonium]
CCWATNQEPQQPTRVMTVIGGNNDPPCSRWEKPKVRGFPVNLTDGDNRSLYVTMTRLEGQLVSSLGKFQDFLCGNTQETPSHSKEQQPVVSIIGRKGRIGAVGGMEGKMSRYSRNKSSRLVVVGPLVKNQ